MPENIQSDVLYQAVTFHQKGQFAQAQALYEQFLKEHPQHFDALQMFAHLAYQTNRQAMAAELLYRAIAINPKLPSLYSNIGLVLQGLGRFDEALRNHDKAIALEPAFFNAYNNRGNVLMDIKRADEALISYDKAIALQPRYAEAHYNRGNALRLLNRLQEAVLSYDKAIALKPDYADAYNGRGIVLKNLKRMDEAVASFAKALALKPDFDFLLGTLLHTRMMLCDWQGLAESLERCEADIRSSRKIIMPFPALALLDSPELHWKASRIFAETKFPKLDQLGIIEQRERRERIRIGYYSADFYNHATTYLMAELFESHDTARFEFFGFSFGPNLRDDMYARVSSAFEHFFDVSNKSDLEIAQLSRELGIDIAIDLKGFTTDARTGIFAARCAPIQVNYLGYPGTLAVEYMDYIIADAIVIPEDRQSDYTEKVVYLPHSYQVNDAKRKISERVFSREECGLPETGFVFCCFNNNFKILPAMFDVWMKILQSIDGSVLWLLEDNPSAAKNLRKEARVRGVDESRLIFAQRVPLDEHLARHRLADLFMDTLPYNAHTTASDALWAGLPVLTCAGKSFASRVAASLLKAIELPELITNTLSEYEAKAIALASSPERLADIRSKLQSNRLKAPLFDTQLFARHIESAYAAMYERYVAGLAPESLVIKADE